jgi:FixJ family two-component response regulator
MKGSGPMVYVVDDDPSLRSGIERLLRSHSMRVSTFSDPREFLQLQHDQGPACLVLDVMMPELNGLEVQAELNEAASHIPIIFITGHGTVPISVRALKEGAVDFIEKPFEEEHILSAIRAAHRRHTAILADEKENEGANVAYATLTPREREVMALVVKGCPNKEIADLLLIAEKTVKVHRGRVMQKMDAESLAALVRMAERAELG